MEAHLAKDEISTCSTFESPTSEKLQVSVRLQQDIGPEGEKNPCHSSSLPSDDCVFTKVDSETHYLNFKQPISDAVEHATDDSSKYYTIDADGAIPNLVAHVRKILAASAMMVTVKSRSSTKASRYSQKFEGGQ